MDKGVFRDLGHAAFKGAHVRRPADLLAVRPAEDEIPEAEMIAEKGVDLLMQAGRKLVGEIRRDGGGALRVGGIRTDQQQRNVKAFAFDPFEEVDAGVSIESAVARVAHIRDDAQDIGLVSIEEARSLLVVLGHQDLGPGAHGEQPVLLVQPFLHHRLDLGDHLLVEQRQQGGKVDRRVLHEQNHPNPGRGGIGGSVPTVFGALDHGQQQIGVAGPDENAIHPEGFGEFRAVQGGGDLRLVAQLDHRQVRIAFLDLMSEKTRLGI